MKFKKWKCLSLLTVFALSQFMACNPSPLNITPTTTAASLGLRFPAEWEHQGAVWFGWWVTNYGGEETPTESLMLEMISALASHVTIKIAVQNADEEATVRALLTAHDISLSHIIFYQLRHNDFWFRDMGPVYLINGDNQKAIIDSGFDYWSYGISLYGDNPADDEALDRTVASLESLPVLKCNIVSEGGNVDVNGAGTALITKSVALRRNPEKTLQQLEDEYKRCYGLKKIIWLERGVVEDDGIYEGILPGGGFNPGGTAGHVDDYVRFAPGNKILLAEVPQADLDSADTAIRARAEENKSRLDADLAILNASTDQDGNPFTIVRIPTADAFTFELNPGDPFYDYYVSASPFEDGSSVTEGDTLTIVATASYLNFVVSNDVVLVPNYWSEGLPTTIQEKDADVVEKLQAAYPGRTIVPLHYALGANYGAGGPHCMTQQEPSE